MSVTNDFLEYVLDQLSAWGGIEVKRMFGGAGLYRDGLMFALVARNSVFLKVDDTNRDKYVKLGSKQLRPFESKATVLSFYELPVDVFEDSDEFVKWAKESLAIQLKRMKIKKL
jgi:DNA transformation protein